ncbi:MAG: hypothetical protein ACRDGV_09500 [Candidatus Limnocylindria bacterium]
MSQANLLARITCSLEDAGIPHMVVGSLASSLHGEPRTTRDIDLVIDPSADAMRQFVDSLPETDFYVDSGAAAEALERRTSFNVIEMATGWKVDLLVRRDRPFSREELDRRLRIRMLETDTYVATAEDTIVAKLEWAKEGEPERHLRDVAGVLRMSGETLDHDYLERWIAALDLTAIWVRARRLA